MAKVAGPRGRAHVDRLGLVGLIGTAVLLGLAVAVPAAPAWLSLVLVVGAVLIGAVRPVGAAAWSVALLVLLLTATTTGAATGARAVESAALTAASALLHAAVIAVPLGLVELSRRRREYRRQGWELARARSREERARTDAALVRERAVMAGEIHDHLGHRLALASVQLGRLTLDSTLPPASRAALEEARRGVADAAAELGETVQLLTAGDRTPVRAPERPLAEIVRTARSAGVPVEASLEGLEHDLSAHAHAALGRVLSEALANAAKHAPGHGVRVHGQVTGGTAVLRVTNPRADVDGGTTPSSGHGLPSLRHRLELLDGDLEVADGEEFSLRAVVPVDATLHTRDEDGGGVLADIQEAERAAERSARRTGRLAWAVPVGLAAGAVLVTVGFYLFLATASTLSPERFARVEVGMTQDEAAALLPAVQMVEAPRDVLAEPAGSRCVYHEEEVSLFVREDVFRVCFADGVVVSTDTIPGPRGAP